MMRRHHRLWSALTLVIMACTSLVTARPAAAREPVLCFPETGQCIEGRFREYWEQNGGLAVFGLPITAERQERNRETGKTHLTQWFERNRFELHPENQPPYDILLGRLGDDRLRTLGRDWQQLPRDNAKQSGCLWFPQTQLNVCNQGDGGGAQAGFRSYWLTQQLNDSRLDAYGRSLALFGLPLTRPRMETNSSGDTVLTQWFERARFEWHPNNPPGHRVLLGLLGNEVRPAAEPPKANLTTYTSRDGAWSVQYPANLLHPEDLGGGTIVFISQDRSAGVAVDSYLDQGNAYGNTGEGLRNRARDTLARIYGRRVTETGVLDQPGGRWEVGLGFRSDGGSLGEAVYEQRGRQQGIYRVNGVLYGYKGGSNNAASTLAALRAVRDSFRPASDPAQALLGYFQLLNQGRYAEAVALYGGDYEQLRIFNPALRRNDYAGLFEYACRGLLKCLTVRRIVSEQVISSTESRFVVEFANKDGSLFQLGPLEGSQQVFTQFPYTVKKIAGRYAVMELPVYVP